MLSSASPKRFQFVGMADDVGDVGVAEHAAAVGQHGALNAQHRAVGAADVARRAFSAADLADTIGDIGVHLIRRHFVSAYVAAVIEQRYVGRPAFGDCIGQPPNLAKGAVDELGTQVGVEQNDACFYLVHRRTQRQHFPAYQRVRPAARRVRDPVFCPP
jgi:hypothetical protein